MNPKKLVSRLLLAFVAVALLIATADVTGLKKNFAGTSLNSAGTQATKPATSDDIDHRDDARYAAIFYHAKHRCETCVKIEEYAHTALLPAIENGELAWEISEYTAPENREVVRSMDVMTSTVVLTERENGKIVRYKNLEDVWLHTNHPDRFAAYITDSWKNFRESL